MSDHDLGPTLLEASSWLQDDAARHEQILDVAERNSVIEGLPPFTDAFKSDLRRQLREISENAQSRHE
jgi:hypothetical protein